MARGKVENVFVILAELWPDMEIGRLFESFSTVTDYSIWDFTAFSTWVKANFVFKIKDFKNTENNYFSHGRNSVYLLSLKRKALEVIEKLMEKQNSFKRIWVVKLYSSSNF